MKYFWSILFVSSLISCGPFVAIKRNNYIESKGYNPQKDTLIVKPYEYYSKHKGYVPIFRQNDCPNKKDIKISIVGFEEVDTIAFERLFQPMSLSFPDSTIRLNHGELYFIRNGISYVKYFDKSNLDSCSCNFSFEYIKEKWRKKGKSDALLFWNVSINKDSAIYCIPNRVYYLK